LPLSDEIDRGQNGFRFAEDPPFRLARPDRSRGGDDQRGDHERCDPPTPGRRWLLRKKLDPISQGVLSGRCLPQAGDWRRRTGRLRFEKRFSVGPPHARPARDHFSIA
jgi:hypothetical protein